MNYTPTAADLIDGLCQPCAPEELFLLAATLDDVSQRALNADQLAALAATRARFDEAMAAVAAVTAAAHVLAARLAESET